MNHKDSKAEQKEHDKAEKAAKAAEPPVQEYPKMLYHADGRNVTVANAEEEATMTASGFAETQQPPAEPKAKG